MKIYIAVTNDKYELPVAVADTQEELGIMTGKKKDYVCRFMGKERPVASLLYKKVEVEE